MKKRQLPPLHRRRFYLDITLAEIAYWYLVKKKIDLTTGNLFSVMHQILQRVDRINKNKPQKIIKFSDGTCEFEERQ